MLIHILEAFNQHNSPRTRTNPVVPVRVCHMPRIKHTYRIQARTLPMIHKEQFYTLDITSLIYVGSNLLYKPWVHERHIKPKLKVYCIYILSRSSATIKTYLRYWCLAQGHHHSLNDLLLPRTRIGGVEVAEHHFRLTCN